MIECLWMRDLDGELRYWGNGQVRAFVNHRRRRVVVRWTQNVRAATLSKGSNLTQGMEVVEMPCFLQYQTISWAVGLFGVSIIPPWTRIGSLMGIRPSYRLSMTGGRGMCIQCNVGRSRLIYWLTTCFGRVCGQPTMSSLCILGRYTQRQSLRRREWGNRG